MFPAANRLVHDFTNLLTRVRLCWWLWTRVSL